MSETPTTENERNKTMKARTLDRRTLIQGSMATAAIGGMSSAMSISSLAAQDNGSDKIIVMTGTEAETLDPHFTGTRNTQILTEAIHSGMFTRDTDNNIVPDLVAEWEISEDQLTWTFTLREDAKFSDGSQVTADAVKFSIDRILDPANNANVLPQFATVENIEVIDDLTVAFHTSVPFAALDEVFADPGPKIIQPEAASGNLEDYGRNPVGSGPYMLEEWNPGQSTELIPNPHYFGPTPQNAGISFRYAAEGGARTAALESGQVDVITALPPESIERISNNSELEVLVADSSFLIFFVLDHGSAPFDDVRVRRAANMAIDREAIIDTILGGLGSVANSPLGQGVMNRAEFDPFPYDPEGARELLIEAGYPDGCPILMWGPQGRYLKDRQVAEAVQAFLAEAGFEPDLQIMEWGTYLQEREADPPIAQAQLIGASIPGSFWNTVNNFHSDSDYPNSYSNPEVDDLILRASQAFDLEEQAELYRQLQQIVFEEDVVHLYLHGQMQVLGHRSSVSGLNPLPLELFDVDTLTKDE